MLAFIIFLVAALMALASQRKLQEINPELRGYLFGYFIGYYALIMSLAVAAISVTMDEIPMSKFLFILAACAVSGISGWLVLRRMRIGWLLGLAFLLFYGGINIYALALDGHPEAIALSGLLVPVGLYLQRRWGELAIKFEMTESE